MPFYYDLIFEKYLPADGDIYFVSWIDEVWNKYQEQPVAFALGRGRHGEGFFKTNGACFLKQKGILAGGQDFC